jgi:hypothetical protein
MTKEVFDKYRNVFKQTRGQNDLLLNGASIFSVDTKYGNDSEV